MILRFGKAVCCAHRNVPGTSAWLTTVGQRQLIVIGYQRLRYKQRPQQGSANVGIAFGIRFRVRWCNPLRSTTSPLTTSTVGMDFIR